MFDLRACDTYDYTPKVYNPINPTLALVHTIRMQCRPGKIHSEQLRMNASVPLMNFDKTIEYVRAFVGEDSEQGSGQPKVRFN